MKILMVAPTPFFADRGCHTRIYNEIIGLQELGHEILLCTYGLGREIEGVKTKRIINFPWYKKLTAGPSVTKILYVPILMFSTFCSIVRFKPDVVHAFLHEGAFIIKACSIFLRKPMYVFDLQGSLSGEILQHNFVKKNGLFHKFFLRLEYRINSWFPIITQSDNLYKKLIDMNIDPENVINAMDSVDVNLFSPRAFDQELADKLGIDKKKPRILYMGLLEEYQGVDILFDALENVYKYNQQIQILIIGFPNIDKYKTLSREKGIYDNVWFLGKIPFEEVPRYLSLSEIAVAPKISEHEGDGKVYNYMAMGMAAAAFDRSVSREILGKDSDKRCGLLANYLDSDDLAEKICSLIENPALCSEIGKNARKRAERELSHLKSAEMIYSFYKMHIEKKQAGES